MTWINSTVAAYLVKKHLELETVPSEWGPGAGAAGQPRSWMYYVGGVIIVGILIFIGLTANCDWEQFFWRKEGATVG
ncbi:unnamed protein product [Fusarium graminearum]|uniref:Chromosome 3, complete genome n=2 Tax=Gibberella zeae TaxID=5518 RepID=A0A0E0SN73_GIBZE|nr:hypothetical protein FG05_30557 [Fusarium graminearum]CAG1996502.1 unnamed protein product [Fusarium graminearum]CAG1999842.1 unnamed protein product [Fusarium graminearum]CEF87886.1 unnamed protein product [Fusarium graminearum]CZS85992.1 unnamed protein product [Fusarium graminearum]